MEQSKAGSLTLAKGLQVLKIVAAADKSPRFVDLVAMTGLPKPTLHRMLATLIESGMLRLNGNDQTYQLGAQLISMSQRVWRDYDLPRAAKDEMARLQNLTGETVTLGMLSGDEVVHVDQISGQHQIGLQSQLGRREPIYCTAIGKAILAFTDPIERAQLVSTAPLQAWTSRTIVDRDALHRELIMIRARGYALDEEEYSEGQRGVAAPILDHTGRAIGAVALAGPAFRLSSAKLHDLGPDLIETTRRASLSVGGVPLPVAPGPRPTAAVSNDMKCVLEIPALLGESPLWCPRRQKLFWLDLYAPALHAFDPKTGENATWPQREISSAVALAGNKLLLARHSGPAVIDPDSDAAAEVIDSSSFSKPTHRFNDAKVDARGRFWAGYMTFPPEPGQAALFRIDAGQRAIVAKSGLTLPNGIAWTDDNRKMYLTDTAERTIYLFDFDLEAGAISNQRTFLNFSANVQEAPDGIVIDDEGCLWVAMWDGWCLKRFSPEGRLVQVLPVPVPRPTSMAFGGPDMKRLFITSARIRLSSEALRSAPLSGSLFAIDLPVGGRVTHNFGRKGR